MDNLFKIRTLTAAINKMDTPGNRIFNRFFKPKLNMQPSDRLAFDIITGSQSVLQTLSLYMPARVGSKTARQTVTLQAPRLSEKRMIHAAEMNAMRAYGSQLAVEMFKSRINRELTDLRAKFDRTLEFWASRALTGKIYDADMSTVLLDYGLDTTHDLTISVAADKWSATDTAEPLQDLRTWKRLVEQDSSHDVTTWYAFCGWQAMDSLLKNADIRDLLKYQGGMKVLDTGQIGTLDGVTIEEYNKQFVDGNGTTQYFIPPNKFILVGMGNDVFDCPYAPIMDHRAPNGVGNVGAGAKPVPYFAKSWDNEDPSGTWIKGEIRPLPVLQRVEAIVAINVQDLV